MSVKNFIPQIWSARLLAHLDKIHVYAGLVNRDYEGEIKQYGDTVKINQIGDITIKKYTGAKIDDPEELTGEQNTLVIDQANYFNFAIKDVDNAQTNPKLMNEAMARAAYGLNDTVDSLLAGIMVAGAAGAIGSDESPFVPTKDDAYDLLVDLGTELTEKNVPLVGRWVDLSAMVLMSTWQSFRVDISELPQASRSMYQTMYQIQRGQSTRYLAVQMLVHHLQSRSLRQRATDQRVTSQML